MRLAALDVGDEAEQTLPVGGAIQSNKAFAGVRGAGKIKQVQRLLPPRRRRRIILERSNFARESFQELLQLHVLLEIIEAKVDPLWDHSEEIPQGDWIVERASKELDNRLR